MLTSEKSQIGKPNTKKIIFGNDYLPIKYPIVISNYHIKKDVHPFGVYFAVQNSNAYEFPPKLILYTCAIQIFLNLDSIGQSSLNDTFKNDDTNGTLLFPEDYFLDHLVPNGFLKILFPHIICDSNHMKDYQPMCPYNDQSYESDNGQSIPPHFEKLYVYQLIVVHNFVTELEVITNYWVSVFQFNLQLNLNAVGNKPVKLVVSLQQNQNSNILSYSFYYIHQCDYLQISYKFLGNSLLDNVIRQNVDYPVYIEILPSDWMMGDSNIPLEYFSSIKSQMVQFAKENGISFLNFQPWMNVDIAILYEMYSVNRRNKSISTKCYNSYAKTQVYFQNEYAHLLGIDEETIQFLTCGGISIGSLSLDGYISAFDKWTWITFIFLNILTASFFVAIRSLFCAILKNKGSISSEMVFPFIVFLDQDSKTAGNKRGQNYMYFVSAAWLLALIVLSNAYKGENITELTAPIAPIKPQLFNDILNKNFTIYCRSTGIFLNSIMDTLKGLFGIADPVYSGNILQTLLNYATANKVVKKLRNILDYTRNLTRHEMHQENDIGINMYISKLESCENVAFVSWSGDIRNAEIQLKKRLKVSKQMNENQVNRIVSVGKEKLFSTRKGWNLFQASMPIKSILFRFSAMYESGIAKQWKQWELWIKRDGLHNQFNWAKPNIAHKLGLNDNFVVVFYIQLVLIAICMLEFLLELLVNLVVGICFTTFVVRIPVPL